MSAASRATELEKIRMQIKALKLRANVILEEDRHAKAVEWIKANGVTIDQVQLSDDVAGMPFFTILDKFLEWVYRQPTQKRFCEWNRNIYFTDDLKNHRWETTKATMNDLAAVETKAS